jgi:hypothetical protein
MSEYVLNNLSVREEDDVFFLDVRINELAEGNAYGISFGIRKGLDIVYFEETLKKLARELHRLKYEGEDFVNNQESDYESIEETDQEDISDDIIQE